MLVSLLRAAFARAEEPTKTQHKHKHQQLGAAAAAKAPSSLAELMPWQGTPRPFAAGAGAGAGAGAAGAAGAMTAGPGAAGPRSGRMPQLVSRRVLDLVTWLARCQPSKVAQQLISSRCRRQSPCDDAPRVLWRGLEPAFPGDHRQEGKPQDRMAF